MPVTVPQAVRRSVIELIDSERDATIMFDCIADLVGRGLTDDDEAAVAAEIRRVIATIRAMTDPKGDQ